MIRNRKPTNPFVRLLIKGFVITALVSTTSSCLKTSQDPNSTNATAQAKKITSSVPPFNTREPDHYSATRVITKVGGTDNNAPDTSTSWIARDGVRRREEYQLDSNERVVYLFNSEGSFVLLPSEKIFGLVPPQGSEGPVDRLTVDQENPATALLAEDAGAATYETLGEETVGNRKTMKYRVTPTANNPSGATSETLIWIDQAFGIPVHSETKITDGNNSSSVTMDLRDLSDSVNEKQFEVPNDYQRVSADKIVARLRQMPAQ